MGLCRLWHHSLYLVTIVPKVQSADKDFGFISWGRFGLVQEGPSECDIVEGQARDSYAW